MAGAVVANSLVFLESVAETYERVKYLALVCGDGIASFHANSHHFRSLHWHLVHFRSWRCPLPSDLPTGVLSPSKAAIVR